jgi:putative acetyltransferase
MATIRLEEPGDRDAVRRVHTACFPTDAEARLVEALRQSARLVISLVAEVDGAVVGHVAFSPVTTRRGDLGLGLAPVAVLPSHRRQGIAHALIRQGLERCGRDGYAWAVVLGDPAYYRRFGFIPAPSVGLSDAYGGGDAFQIMEIRPRTLPRNAGLVEYGPEFALVG